MTEGKEETTPFTPGPWSVSDINADDLRHAARFGNVVVYADDDCETHPVADCSCNHTCRETDEQIANARLIAAAPDLLAALKGVLRIADRKTVEFDAARAAIAKAEGSGQ